MAQRLEELQLAAQAAQGSWSRLRPAGRGWFRPTAPASREAGAARELNTSAPERPGKDRRNPP